MQNDARKGWGGSYGDRLPQVEGPWILRSDQQPERPCRGIRREGWTEAMTVLMFISQPIILVFSFCLRSFLSDPAVASGFVRGGVPENQINCIITYIQYVCMPSVHDFALLGHLFLYYRWFPFSGGPNFGNSCRSPLAG